MGLANNKWFSLVQLLAPVILTAVKPQLAPIAGNVTNAILEAEAMKGATGKAKLDHVINIATAAADSLNMAHGKEVVHVDSLHEAITLGASAVVNAVNAVHK